MKFEFGLDCPDFAKLAKKELNARVRVRMIAMDQLKAGKSIKEIAKFIQIEEHAIGNWYRWYRELGIEGLYDLPRSGARPKLPKEKEAEFIKRIAGLQAEKEGGRITGYDIQAMALKEFGVDYAEDSIYTVLKRLKISWVTGRSKHPKSDEDIQKAFKKEFKKKCSRFFPKESI